MRGPWNKAPRSWDIRVTTPDGVAFETTTADLESQWNESPRSNDGYVELLHMPGYRLWAKPTGHEETDRSEALKGTAPDLGGRR